MKIQVNGKPHEFRDNGSLADLLKEFSANIEHVAVMINDKIVKRSGADKTILKDGDRVEILTLVAGG